MKCLSLRVLLAVLPLLPLEPCVAEEAEHALRSPVETASAPASNLAGEMNLAITAADNGDAKWRRDVLLPKLPQLMRDDRLETFLSGDYLDSIKRILAQANVSQVTPAAAPGPQVQGDKLELTLKKSLEIALNNNLDLTIAELTRDAVETEIPRTEARFHPNVGLAFTGSGAKDVVEGERSSHENAQVGTVFVAEELPTGTGASVILSGDLVREEHSAESYSSVFGISIVQPLLRGAGVFVATRQISDAQFDLAVEEARLRSEVLGVTAATKAAYYNVLLAEKVIAVTEEAIQRDRALLEASQALLDAGLVTKRDLFSAEISLANDSAQLVSNQADLESAKNRLLEVLGLPIDTAVILLDKDISLQPVQMDLPTWIARAVKNRPEVLELEQQLAKSALNVGVAKNTVLPQTDLVASYDKGQSGSSLRKALDFRGRGWSVGVLFSYPIWNQAAKSQLARAEIEHRRLEETLRRTKRDIELEVRASVIKINRSLERIKPLMISLDQAKGKLEIAKARFALGQTTNFDITDAQEEIVDAETALLTAIVDYNIGLAELEAQIAGAL